jgi:hypothetical protein
MLKLEAADRPALVDEFWERTPQATRRDLLAKILAHKIEVANSEPTVAN